MRHGATQANQKGVYCGGTDLPLTRKGIEEVKKTSRKLAGLSIGRVYCSEALRARHTARLAAGGLETIFLASLREMDFGSFEGLCANDIQAKMPEAWQTYMDNWAGFTFPGGDNIRQYIAKAADTVSGIIGANDGNSVLVVSHKGWILSALSHLLHGGAAHIFRYDIRPAGFAKVRISDGHAVLCQLE
jgi:alpha-ribazole phosphatase